MTLLKINGVTMPTPTTLQWGIETIDKAERNANGTMIKERIATKRKLEMSWSYLNASQLSQLLTAVSSNFFSVTYLDPMLNAQRTADFYAGAQTVEAMDYVGGVIRHKNIKFNVIER